MSKHSVGMIVLAGDKVLLVKNTEKSGYAHEIYGAPAGRLEEDENEKQAALRELKEETGLNTTEDSLEEFENNFYVAELDRKEGKVEYSIRFFLVKQYQGELKSSEETIPEWVPIDQLKEMTLVVNVKEAIDAAIKFLNP
ncbi:MAG: NUDIX hydrolase [Candidatus Doudnabacteria bacterium]